jgi:hypothetical protein
VSSYTNALYVRFFSRTENPNLSIVRLSRVVTGLNTVQHVRNAHARTNMRLAYHYLFLGPMLFVCMHHDAIGKNQAVSCWSTRVQYDTYSYTFHEIGDCFEFFSPGFAIGVLYAGTYDQSIVLLY